MVVIEVATRPGLPDAGGAGLLKDIADLGVSGVTAATIIQVYRLEGEFAPGDVDRICRELLCDPITQVYAWQRPLPAELAAARTLEVAYNPGVMDPAEESVQKGIRDLGIGGVRSVRTAKRYVLEGAVSDDALATIADRLLVNRTVQHVVGAGERADLPTTQYRFRLVEIDLLGADDDMLMALSRGKLWLSLEEMRLIQQHFRNLGRNPSDVELETLAQTWSEHCSHKTLKGRINYEGRSIDNLLQATIMKTARDLAHPWCLSVFKDNAGVIAFDDEYAVCFKVETHNHPSALEPYGGAATGIGGVIRDPLGTGLGAKPFVSSDVFCFGPPDLPYERLPQGALHPKRVFKGVRAGVADYGNRMGIPTTNGAILFDERYVGNPLVYCGNAGVMPRRYAERGVQQPGDLVVLVGGRTGRDGIHGATFSSGELTVESDVISGGAVQIGNPIMEKKMVDTLLQARDRGLYRRITDCGGGGLSSAVGEMGEETGVRVYLDRVPLKYAGLAYWEIWISEAQERMIIAVPPEHVDEALAVFTAENVEATVIGEFTDAGRLELLYQGQRVCDLDMAFLHRGMPRTEKEAAWMPPPLREPAFAEPADLTEDLLAILGSWNVCSKEWVVRQYDHEVQGGSALKPLVGAHDDGPGDASITRPLLDSDRGVIISNGINPKYGEIDPYWMAASAIDEALRQIIAVGGSLDRVGLLDNFSWGNPNKPDRLGGLVRACQACYDVAMAYGTPFISGKDSLYNEYEVNGETICIPPTLLVSAIAVMPDVRKAVSMDAKAPGDHIFVVGLTYDELGGSHYYARRGFLGSQVPKVNAAAGKGLMAALSAAIGDGLVRACHDCSEGGIGVALAESAFAGDLGAEIDLRQVPVGEPITRSDTVLFAESNTRFIVEVAPAARAAFLEAMRGQPCAEVGQFVASGRVEITGLDARTVVSVPVGELKEAWQRPLRW